MPLPSKRDHAELRRRLAAWLATKLPAGSEPQVGEVSVPQGTGMSSETLLFDASWKAGDDASGSPGGAAGEVGRDVVAGGEFVARLAPDMSDFPVFPEYDLQLQHRCLQFVAEHSDVPVPEAPWLELDETPLGSPFFVMRRVQGIVPTDMPPYPMGGWVADCTVDQRARLQRNAIGVLARLHAIDVTGPDAAFLDRPQWGRTALDQHLGYQRWYYDWAREGVDYPLIEDAFAWLDARRPGDEGPTVLNWGDSRIGNILFRELEPVAVLDWEMASLGAREVDLAWMIFLHQFFHSMATRYGMPGLPDLLEPKAAVRDYEEQSGHVVRNLEFYEMFAALRFAIISLRTSARAIAYGQMEAPPERQDLIMHRHLIERMLDGSYWQ